MLIAVYLPQRNACLDSTVCFEGILQVFGVAPRTSVLVLSTWMTT